MKITKLSDGYVRITPDKGKKLYFNERYYSEAEVKEEDAVNFKEV